MCAQFRYASERAFCEPESSPYSDYLVSIPLKKHDFYVRYRIDADDCSQILIRCYYYL